jgi:hypothetical protein
MPVLKFRNFSGASFEFLNFVSLIYWLVTTRGQKTQQQQQNKDLIICISAFDLSSRSTAALLLAFLLLPPLSLSLSLLPWRHTSIPVTSLVDCAVNNHYHHGSVYCTTTTLF